MIRELPEELAKIAKDELNENPERVSEDLKYVKDWIEQQPHLRARKDDQWLVAILRGCKYNFEKVKKKLDLYYTLRTTAPDVTLRHRPLGPDFLNFFRLGTCLLLPKPKDQIYPRVILIRAGVYSPETNNVIDIMCILYYVVQIAIIEDDVASVLGTKIMVDYKGVTLSHFVQATPSVLKKIVAVCQESMPLRLKGSHHVNIPTGVDKIFSLISVFLNEKAKKRLRIYKGCQDLVNDLPKDIVPTEYGGDGGSIAELIENNISKFNEFREWMKQEETFGTDESKRLGKGVKSKAQKSLDGSFRKLDID